MRNLMFAVGLCAVGIALQAAGARAAQPKTFRLADEAAGVDGVVRALVSVFDQADIVALGEAHERKDDSELRIALVRDPEFAKKVRNVVVEFASTTEQATLDRYIQGDPVSAAQLARVWMTTTQAPNGVWNDPIYANFLADIRDVNAKLPRDARIRVLGGDPGPTDHRSRETAAVSVIKDQVLEKHAKALVIYGAAHFYRNFPAAMLDTMGDDIGLLRLLEKSYPGRSFSVIPMGGKERIPTGAVAVTPDYGKFDRALQTRVRPVLLSLQRLPFRDFSDEEFLGRTIFTCRSGPCVSAFKGSALKLGQMADACVYFGSDPAAR